MSAARRFYDCHARERGDLCGAIDCRTCHPENFSEDWVLLPVCERCGARVNEVNGEGLCLDCDDSDVADAPILTPSQIRFWRRFAEDERANLAEALESIRKEFGKNKRGAPGA